MSPISLAKRLQALVVDIIRRLWERGHFHHNEWLQQIHDEWFQDWVDVKTANTTADLDRQIEHLWHEWEDDEDLWDFLDEQVGDTPLGGELRATFRPSQDSPEDSGPLS